MFSRAQIEEYRSLNKALACSTCDHVWSGNAAIGAIGHISPHFLVGCCEGCLLSENQILVRADHLYERSPDFLPLLHLPLFGKAVFGKGKWRLSILDLPVDKFELDGRFFVRRTIEEFFAETEHCYGLFVKRGLHFESMMRGARVVPIWIDEKDATKYLRNFNIVSRMFLKVRKFSQSELREICYRNKHNYLAISHDASTREALIINDELIIEENTMQL